MISARRFDRHAAQQRMVQIGSFQPGDVCCNSKYILKHRQYTANYCCRNDAIADGESALQSDHSPVVCRRVKPIDRPDQTKRERQQPDREPDTETGANQFAAPSHLQCQRDCSESADQTSY